VASRAANQAMTTRRATALSLSESLGKVVQLLFTNIPMTLHFAFELLFKQKDPTSAFSLMMAQGHGTATGLYLR